MRIPIVRGIIDRRILVNFHVDADVLARVLPAPFRPKLVGGVGIAGVCLIRLTQLRPRFLPAICGYTSENAAHRIAVEWQQDGKTHEGVYIPRRDTSSRLNTLLGGRVFPGIQYHARFTVDEHDDFYSVSLDSDDRQTHLAVEGRMTNRLPDSSVFGSLQAASSFFEAGSLGFSKTDNDDEFHGIELHAFSWSVQPLAVEKVESSFFDNEILFPKGSVGFDCALLMLQIDHEWHEQPMLCCEPAAG